MRNFLILSSVCFAFASGCVIDDTADDYYYDDGYYADGYGAYGGYGGTTNSGGAGGEGGVVSTGGSATGGSAAGGSSAMGGASEGGASQGGAAQGGEGGGTVEPALRVFVTKNTFEADLSALGSDVLVTADQLCQVSADAAGLGGTFTAWLSTDETAAVDRVQGDAWVDTTGLSIFPNRPTLSTGPANPLGVDEGGAPLVDDVIFTGTSILGTTTGSNCLNWTTSNAGILGTRGHTLQTTSQWTDGGDDTCDKPAHLACFEQKAVVSPP